MNNFYMPRERTYNTKHLLIENASVREIPRNKMREDVVELVHCEHEDINVASPHKSPWLTYNTEYVTCAVTLYDRNIYALGLGPGKDILHTEETCYYIPRSAESLRTLIRVLVDEKNETNDQNIYLQDKISNIKDMKWTKRLKFLFTGKPDEK